MKKSKKTWTTPAANIYSKEDTLSGSFNASSEGSLEKPMASGS